MPASIHFIAIGGSTMHNLAIALHRQGHTVSGSDDEVFEPALSHLAESGLLPEKTGWFPEKIHAALSTVIVGMHARPDNPELLKAQQLGLAIVSYPEFIYSQSLDKQRIVIGGSHGKTTTTAIIMHVLQFYHRKFDYLIGAEVEGFEVMVRLSEEAPLIVIEGDEYLASPIHRHPKLLDYHHHIGLITGIAWDHINVFPTFEEYVKAFENFADNTPKGGILVFAADDDLVAVIGRKERADVTPVEYLAHPHEIHEGKTFLLHDEQKIPVQIFGEHNMKNLNGAKQILTRIGITEEQFYKAIPGFKGANRRLELVGNNAGTAVFRDFAHAPSKLEASIEAVKKQFPERKLVACLELHTFSSLNKKFIRQYEDTFGLPETAVVYFNPQTVAHKKLEMLSAEEIKKGFNHSDLQVFTDKNELQDFLLAQSWQAKNLLLMSSGNFDNLDIAGLAKKILTPHPSKGELG
jgi:UDP-N-acetylmuramate: L-alanyl-gamma-D-glutamyl-meso-diaminopimelate ligase